MERTETAVYYFIVNYEVLTPWTLRLLSGRLYNKLTNKARTSEATLQQSQPTQKMLTPKLSKFPTNRAQTSNVPSSTAVPSVAIPPT